MRHAIENSEFRILNSEPDIPTAPSVLPTFALLALGVGVGGAFAYLCSFPDLRSRTPEVVGLLLAASLLYVIAAFVVQRFALGLPALAIILGGALAFRVLALPRDARLSADVYRYQWEGRVQRAGIKENYII